MIAGLSQASFGTYREGWKWGWGTGVTKVRPANQGNDTLSPSYCDVMWCDTMWYDMIWYDEIWRDVMWCEVIWKSRYSDPVLPLSHLHILSPHLILLSRQQAEKRTHVRKNLHSPSCLDSPEQKTTWRRYHLPLLSSLSRPPLSCMFNSCLVQN